MLLLTVRWVVCHHLPLQPMNCSRRTIVPFVTRTSIADQFAPERTVTSQLRPLCPWFDAECRTIRRNCRRLERGYRRTRDSEHKATYVAACRDKHDVFDQKKKRY